MDNNKIFGQFNGADLDRLEVMARPTFEQAKRLYINRYTMEHVPAWARKICLNGFFYAPQFRSDAEWFANTKFNGDAGWYGIGSDCQTSGQTWPMGEWLESPYYTGVAA